MDDSLDDFFAKKDKSKKKTKTSKSKVVAADLLPSSASPKESEIIDAKVEKALAEELDDLKISEEGQEVPKDKKKSKRKKEKDGKDDFRSKEDDEWNSIEEQKDYSGLRIAAKAIAKESKTDDAAGDADSDAEYDENGQIKPKQNEAVWKIPTASSNDSDTVDTATPVQSPTVEMPNVSVGRYIPPSMRSGNTPAAAKTQEGNLQPMNIKKKKVAPNLASQEEFPTLGSAPPPVDTDTANFTKVRGGASTNQTRSSGVSQELETKNMYSLLQQKQ